jgi:hypothetical protein
MLLRNKLSIVYMTNIDIVVSYLSKVTDLRDYLAITGTKVEDTELVCIAWIRFPPSWNFLSKVFMFVNIYLLMRSFGINLCMKI